MIALISRKKRKTHLAASLDSEQAWAPLCAVPVVPMAACTFQTLDAAYGTVSHDDETVCLPCRRMIALVHILNRIDNHRGGGRHIQAVS